jgi:menaquinone reductase, molybdopterin-binding-like subunit
VTISRRNFLVGATGAGVGFGLGAFSHMFPLASPQFGPDWRPGEETFVASTCLLCPAHCGIRARLIDGGFTRIDGNPLHPVSQGGLCPKGRAGIQLAYHPGRLKGPLQRVGLPGSDVFEPISWDAALDRVTAALRSAHGAGDAKSVEWLVGDTQGVMGELISAFGRAYGTERITVDDYRDGSAEVMRLCQGIHAPPAYDLRSSDLVVSFGAGLSEAWWALPLAARARDTSAASERRWVQIDVRLSRTAVSADKWIPIRPGSYGTLALGLAYLIAKEGLYDDTVAQRVSGWEDWTDETGARHAGFRSLVLRHGAPDNVSSRTGVPVAQLTELAKAFGTARRPVAIWDHAVSWRRGGLSDALAIHALNVLRGSLNRPGGVLVQPPLALPGPLDQAPVGPDDLSRRALTSTTWPHESGDGAPPAAKVLFLYQSNPVASAARTEDVRHALSQIPLVVSFSPFLDESARYANLVLPDHTYLERWQDALAPAAVPFPVWGVVRPVIAPLHNTRATGDVILDLAGRLGGVVNTPFRWSSVEEIVRERGTALAGAQRGSAFVEAFRQDELRELGGRGWWLPHGESPEEYWETVLETGGWFDPTYDYHDRSAVSQHADGRVWIFPAEARSRLQRSGESLAEGFLPITAGPPAPAGTVDGAFPLRLIPFRVLTLASGGTSLMPWLLENLGVLTGHAWEAWAELNPDTARELGLQAGQRVRVESAAGAFETTVRIFSGVQPGVVNVPYGLHTHARGWGEARGANPLAAVGRQVDPVAGLPDWYSTDVRLTAI